MTIIGFPLNAVGGAPAYSGQDVRLANSALMFGASATRMLGAKSGQRIGTPTTVVSATGFNYSVAPHSGVLDVQTSATAGPYLYAITEAEQGTIDAAHATLARVDILTIRVDDPQEDATSTPLLEVVYKAGTAGGSAPTPDTTREHVIAHFNVPASGGGDPTVTWKAGYAVAAGGIVPVAGDAERDLLSTNYGASQTLYADHPDDGLIRWAKGGSSWEAVSSDAPIYCALRMATNQNLTTSDAAVLWDAEISDPTGMHSTVTNPGRITFAEAGLYEITASLYNGNTSGMGTAYARLNGTTALPGSLSRGVGSSAGLPLKVTCSVAASASDYIEIMVSHATASGSIAGGTNQFASTVTCRRLGPA